MAQPAIQWKYVGSQNVAGATLANALDAIYALGTKATYADGVTTRTENSGGAWKWNGKRYQNAGATECLYPCPSDAYNTLAYTVLLGGYDSGTPAPAMDIDATVGGTVLVGHNKNSGAFATWNHATAPMTGGQWSKFWRNRTCAVGDIWHLFESNDAIFLVCQTSTGTVFYTLAGAWVDSINTNSACCETDTKNYAMFSSGSTNANGLQHWNVNRAAGSATFLQHGVSASAAHCGILNPGLATYNYCSRGWDMGIAATATGLKDRAGKFVHIDLYMQSVAASPNDVFLGRVREVYACADTQGVVGEGTAGWAVGASFAAAQDALFLKA